MKDFKSMVIGFLMATCMFLFMGATSSNEMENLYDGKCLPEEAFGDSFYNSYGHKVNYTESLCESKGGKWDWGNLSEQSINSLRIKNALEDLNRTLLYTNKDNNEPNTSSNSGQGRYAITSSSWDNDVFIAIMDTQTGEIINTSNESMRDGYEIIQQFNRRLGK